MPGVVRERPAHINAPHGISHGERDVLTEGLDYMRGYGPALMVSIEAGQSSEAERKVRSLTRKVKSDIALGQRRAHMRRLLHGTVFHALARDGSPKFNSHIIAPLPDAEARDRVIESLNGSKAYGKFVLAEPVDDWIKLPGYLLREATQQAAYRKPIRKAYKGPIPLGVRGGSRVRLSDDLREILVRKGSIEAYTNRYARRLTPKAIVWRESLFAETLPVLAAPPRPKLLPVKRHKIEPVSLPMDYAPTAGDKLHDMRRRRTCAEIGDLIGLSRQQANNADVSRFGLSRRAVRSVLEHASAS